MATFCVLFLGSFVKCVVTVRTANDVKSIQGFLLRQARSLPLHLAKAMSFSVCAQERVETSASRVPRFSRVRLAKIWLSLEIKHSKESVSKQSSIGFQASQHRMKVPRPCCRLFINLAMCKRAFFPKSATPLLVLWKKEGATFHRMNWCKFL